VLGHPDAHEKVRSLAMQARKEHRSLADMFSEDESLAEYRARLSDYQWSVLRNPALYTGVAATEALEIAKRWEEKSC
jgi:adenylosuccinate lyase